MEASRAEQWVHEQQGGDAPLGEQSGQPPTGDERLIAPGGEQHHEALGATMWFDQLDLAVEGRARQEVVVGGVELAGGPGDGRFHHRLAPADLERSDRLGRVDLVEHEVGERPVAEPVGEHLAP